ncbi:NifB/NifX family molybdenum-iron cluster-binding protein [Candidatus Hydrogenedentota bacterium]
MERMIEARTLRNKWVLIFWTIALALLIARTAYEKKHPLVLHGNKARLVAIASTGRDIRSPVSYLFGRAPYFIVCDRLKRTYVSIPNKHKDAQHAAGLRAAQMIAKKKVDAVCGNNIGFEPARVFDKANIEMYTDTKGTVWETLQVFPDSLTRMHEQNVPAHFGITGSKKPIACSSFEAGANIEHIVQGRFLMCLDCGYRLGVGGDVTTLPNSCPRCGKKLHDVITVASPPAGSIKPKIRVF